MIHLMKVSDYDETTREVEGFISVQRQDSQGDIVPIDDLETNVKVWMKRGAPIMDSHTNRHVGKGLNWSKTEFEGVPAIKITGMIFNDTKADDSVWEKIKTEEYTGFSIGGGADEEKSFNTADGHVLKDTELYEVSVCDTPANVDALITSFNSFAKSGKGSENMLEFISKKAFKKKFSELTKEQMGAVYNIAKTVPIQKPSDESKGGPGSGRKPEGGSSDETNIEERERRGGIEWDPGISEDTKNQARNLSQKLFDKPIEDLSPEESDKFESELGRMLGKSEITKIFKINRINAHGGETTKTSIQEGNKDMAKEEVKKQEEEKKPEEEKPTEEEKKPEEKKKTEDEEKPEDQKPEDKKKVEGTYPSLEDFNALKTVVEELARNLKGPAEPKAVAQSKKEQDVEQEIANDVKVKLPESPADEVTTPEANATEEAETDKVSILEKQMADMKKTLDNVVKTPKPFNKARAIDSKEGSEIKKALDSGMPVKWNELNKLQRNDHVADLEAVLGE